MSLRFLELRLENWKGYLGDSHALSLDNAPGLYLVRGRNDLAPDMDGNGAGKSSIFDAISYALYGKTLRDGRPGASVEPWSGERPTKVELQFQRHGVSRWLVRGRRPNLLTLDGANVDQLAVDQVLGLSYQAFCCTIVLPQIGTLFLDLRPEEQARLFAETMDLDVWLRAADAAGQIGRAAKAQEEEAMRDVVNIEGRLDELKSSIDAELTAAERFQMQSLVDLGRMNNELREIEIKLPSMSPGAPPDLEALSVAEKVVDLARGACSEAVDAFNGARAAIGGFSSQLRDIDWAISQLDKAPDVCPECGQVVAKSHIAGKRKAKQADRAKVVAQIDAAKKRAEVCEVQERKANSALAAARAHLEAMRPLYAVAARDHASIVAEVSKLQDRQAQLRLDAKRQLKLDNPHAKRAGEMITRQEALEVDKDAAQVRRDEASWSAAAYNYWAQAYRQIRLDLIDGCLHSLEQAANQAADMMGLHGWRIEIVTEKETASGKVTRGVGVFLYPPGAEEPVKWEAYCGGEDQRWQLAVRFALSEMLLDVAGLSTNIEILDEPSIHMSPGGVAALLVCLKERAARLGRQVWIVEHHVLDASVFDATLVVENSVQGSSFSWEV